MKYLILAASVLALSACGNPDTPTGEAAPGANTQMDSSSSDSSMADSESTQASMVVNSAFIRPPLPGRDIAAGFMDITNSGANDRLVSVKSPVSESVEIHNNLMEDGVMKMRKVEGIDLPAQQTTRLKPGGYHIMMFGAAIPDGAEAISLTLNYEKAEPMTLMVPLGEPGPEMDMKDGMDH